NASIQRSDQAFLFSATALSAAAGGTNAPNFSSSTGKQTGVPAFDVNLNNALLPGVTSTAVLDTNGKPTGAFSTPSNTVIQSTPLRQGLPGFSQTQIKLEPTLHLDQMARYLNHLHELRRINEGDDTADSPGYSLNLMRIPVSVLPGNKTR